MNQRRFADPVEAQDIAASTDRRDGDRYRTVWRIAKVMRNGDAGLWRVRNISDRGMMLAADVPLAVGEKLEIALSGTVALRGEVVWSEAGRGGGLFDKGVDFARMAKQLAADTRAHSRMGAGRERVGRDGYNSGVAVS